MSTHAYCTVNQFFNAVASFENMGHTVVLAGDIVDLTNCKKRKIDDAFALIDKISDKFGSRYLCGNHELNFVEQEYYKHPQHDVLIAHGHRELWGEKKYEKYLSNSQPGAGFLKRAVLPCFDYFRRFKPPTVGDEQQVRIDRKLGEYSSKIFICGHTHASEMLIKDNVILLPRGFNAIDPSIIQRLK